MTDKPTYYEFFAGGGMARAGLGAGWRCLFANDFDKKKAESYRANWGDDELFVGDVRTITTKQLPEQADLVWASFPCQDLSLAGAGAGLKGERSGTFWPFWGLMKKLRKEKRAPKIIVLENVCGALTSHGGKDFISICEALGQEKYKFGALVIDAALFVPQSRPRLFVVAVRDDVPVPASLIRHCERSEAIQSSARITGLLRYACNDDPFHSRALIAAQERLPKSLSDSWLWWSLAAPAKSNVSLAQMIESNPRGVCWHDAQKTQKLIALMNGVNLDKLDAAKRAGRRVVGTLYRRTRYESGARTQRAEVRFDDVAGCLRTPAGGSSRQFVLVVENERIRSRLISARETARLMGLPDDYLLPARYSDAYHLTGDGVVVPVVRHIAAHLLAPMLGARALRDAA